VPPLIEFHRGSTMRGRQLTFSRQQFLWPLVGKQSRQEGGGSKAALSLIIKVMVGTQVIHERSLYIHTTLAKAIAAEGIPTRGVGRDLSIPGGQVNKWQGGRAPPRMASHQVRIPAHSEENGELFALKGVPGPFFASNREGGGVVGRTAPLPGPIFPHRRRGGYGPAAGLAPLPRAGVLRCREHRAAQAAAGTPPDISATLQVVCPWGKLVSCSL